MSRPAEHIDTRRVGLAFVIKFKVQIMSYSKGTTVEWDWGNGTGTGKVVQAYTRKITIRIKGSEVTRDACEDAPAYKIEQHDGDEVLKPHSELRKAS